MESCDANIDQRVRQLAERLNCMTEEDFRILAGATPLTVEAWRKRGKGPAYIRIGRRFFYPFEAVSEFMEGAKRSPRNAGVALL